MSNELSSDELGLSLLEFWLKNHPNPDREDFGCGSRMYSARQIFQEAQRGTEIGVEHIRMILTAYRKSGLSSPEKFTQRYLG